MKVLFVLSILCLMVLAGAWLYKGSALGKLRSAASPAIENNQVVEAGADNLFRGSEVTRQDPELAEVAMLQKTCQTTVVFRCVTQTPIPDTFHEPRHLVDALGRKHPVTKAIDDFVGYTLRPESGSALTLFLKNGVVVKLEPAVSGPAPAALNSVLERGRELVQGLPLYTFKPEPIVKTYWQRYASLLPALELPQRNAFRMQASDEQNERARYRVVRQDGKIQLVEIPPGTTQAIAGVYARGITWASTASRMETPTMVVIGFTPGQAAAPCWGWFEQQWDPQRQAWVLYTGDEIRAARQAQLEKLMQTLEQAERDKSLLKGKFAEEWAKVFETHRQLEARAKRGEKVVVEEYFVEQALIFNLGYDMDQIARKELVRELKSL